MSTVAFIFARSGSKGLPRKNVRLLGGKPLIAHAIECAIAVKSIDRVIVSTDSVEIAEISRKYGAETPFIRPLDLASDDSPEWLSWQHALKYLRDYDSASLPKEFIVLPVTAPLRKPSDVEECLEVFRNSSADIVITVTEASRNPYFNMVKRNNNGEYDLVLSGTLSPKRRQDTPKVFDVVTTCYVARPDFVLNNDSIFQGKVRAVHVPKERAIDIDSLLDFKLAEYLFSIKEEFE